MPALTVDEVAESAQRAAARIAGLVRETPLDYSPRFSEECAAEVWFKLENLQHTGSFKLRGAANRLMTLTPEQLSAGCVAASSGNHGAAVAYAMGKLNVSGVIFVPEQTTPTKVDAIRSYGGDVRFFGTDGLDTELHARDYAEQKECSTCRLITMRKLWPARVVAASRSQRSYRMSTMSLSLLAAVGLLAVSAASCDGTTRTCA